MFSDVFPPFPECLRNKVTESWESQRNKLTEVGKIIVMARKKLPGNKNEYIVEGYSDTEEFIVYKLFGITVIGLYCKLFGN